MLYFAYGSNLNHKQMKKRCKNSKFLKPYNLRSHVLSFSHMTSNAIYGHANIIKKSNSIVPGAIWKISQKDERSLDFYEGVDYNYYSKRYFKINKKKVLVYVQSKYFLKKPNSTYLHTIIQGYKDCKLNLSYLKKKIKKYSIEYKIKW
tara:strand:+ start:5498 stop:5941 length:444 start_codon:yes stop_codon:yes gene_type:complete